MVRKKKKKSSLARDLTLLIGFFIGALIFLYPTISDIWNFYRDQRLIADYGEVVKALSQEDYSEFLEEAREYNRQHTVNQFTDVFEEEEQQEPEYPYDSLLNPAGNSIMGYLQIPKIDVELAIYHGTGADALERGCGHLQGTSLPVGGESTHAVLSAHRGLPSAKLFTDLDQLEIGDSFFITVLGEKLAYEVDQILTVLPEELDALEIQEGEDLVTLVTCTPYAVNTHRLLVRGHRVEYVEQTAAPVTVIEKVVEQTGYTRVISLVAMIVFFILVILIWLVVRRRRKKK